jgi:drug/metabolite transporter (DMT)-like permease
LNEFIYFAQNNNLTIQIADKDSNCFKNLLIMKAFWTKYHVFIVGLISSVCLTLSEFNTAKEVDYLVLGYAVFVAVGSYFAKNLRGQGATIAGILLTTGANIYTVLHEGGQVNISQVLLTVCVAIGMALASPAKTIEYEQSATIQQAKVEAKELK